MGKEICALPPKVAAGFIPARIGCPNLKIAQIGFHFLCFDHLKLEKIMGHGFNGFARIKKTFSY